MTAMFLAGLLVGAFGCAAGVILLALAMAAWDDKPKKASRAR